MASSACVPTPARAQARQSAVGAKWAFVSHLPAAVKIIAQVGIAESRRVERRRQIHDRSWHEQAGGRDGRVGPGLAVAPAARFLRRTAPALPSSSGCGGGGALPSRGRGSRCDRADLGRDEAAPAERHARTVQGPRLLGRRSGRLPPRATACHDQRRDRSHRVLAAAGRVRPSDLESRMVPLLCRSDRRAPRRSTRRRGQPAGTRSPAPGCRAACTTCCKPAGAIRFTVAIDPDRTCIDVRAFAANRQQGTRVAGWAGPDRPRLQQDCHP